MEMDFTPEDRLYWTKRRPQRKGPPRQLPQRKPIVSSEQRWLATQQRADDPPDDIKDALALWDDWNLPQPRTIAEVAYAAKTSKARVIKGLREWRNAEWWQMIKARRGYWSDGVKNLYSDILAAIKAQKLGVMDVVRLSGVSQDSVRRWMRGEYDPPIKDVAKIADVVGLEIRASKGVAKALTGDDAYKPPV